MRVGLDARLVGPGLGIAGFIRALARGLPALGVDVVWFGKPELAPDEVFEAVTPAGPGFAGLDSPRGRVLVARRGVDVMHFAANSGWWSPGPVPHVLTVHDLMWGRFVHGRSMRQLVGHRYLRIAVPRAIRGAAAIASPSSTTARAVRARFGAEAEVIHNGVSEMWRSARPQPSRERYVVAFSGRDPRKGTEISLEAAMRIAARGVRLVLLAGAGIPADLERRITSLAARGQIEVLPYQTSSKLSEIVAGALALLYPSREEGFGLPVVEAMAAGVPVITGLAPVTLEIGGTAVLTVSAQDPVGDAVVHLERLLDDAGLRSSLAVRGRERAAAFTWSVAVQRYHALYESALRR